MGEVRVDHQDVYPWESPLFVDVLNGRVSVGLYWDEHVGDRVGVAQVRCNVLKHGLVRKRCVYVLQGAARV
eukprot:11514524-Prorocentrum_lima.AAC.1